MRAVRIFLSVTFSFLAYAACAQTGNYFLAHHTPSDENIDYLSFDIVQNNQGVIYFANKTGVVEFDGRNWNVIGAPGSIYTLEVDDNNQLYAGGLTGFGKFSLDENNNLRYQSLSDELSVKNVFASELSEGHIYFMNESQLFDFNITDQRVDIKAEAVSGQNFAGLYEINGSIYIVDSNEQLFLVQSGSLVSTELPFLEGEEIIFTSRLPEGSKHLIGTAAGRLFQYDGQNALEIISEDGEYLVNNVIVNGCWVNQDLIAVGTLSGGVVFINPKSGKTEEIINYYTGLPDNEVFALMMDRKQGVWVAHDYGFTRIAPYLPFRSFNHYPGLSGNLLSAYSDSTSVYVGTSVGLFKLIKEEIYVDETYYVTRYRKLTVEEETVERKKSKKGIFGFLKKNKNKEEEEDVQQAAPKEEVKKEVVKKTRKVLQSLDYVYKKVEGISGKVTQLMQVDGKLVATGVSGAFLINHITAEEILGDPIRTVFYSPTLNQLLLSTYDDKIRSLQWKEEAWEETFLLDTLRQYVSNIFEDQTQNIWLCGRAEVLKVELLNRAISSISSVPFSSPVLDETMGFSLGTNVFVAASGSFHQYNSIDQKFERYDSLPGPRKYFASQGTFWFNDGHRWKTVDHQLQKNLRLEWLGLFSDIRSLTIADGGKGLWLITSANELYKFNQAEFESAASNYPLFLKEVRGPLSKLAPRRALVVDQQESALSFEFIQPDYTNAMSVEYQYMIEGISKDWSSWASSNNIVNFPFLTPGVYKLRIKSRDLFGQVSELQSVDFRVVPPYWQQTWFYALEFVFFGTLVLISLRLSAFNNRYRHISQLLSILTVIMLIQLMQNTVESFIEVQTTPVIDFFIQVLIALLILPLEYWMRRIMIGASEGKYNLSKIKFGLKKE